MFLYSSLWIVAEKWYCFFVLIERKPPMIFKYSYKVDSVEYILNPTIFRKFYECKRQLAIKHNLLYESMNCYLLFHGIKSCHGRSEIQTYPYLLGVKNHNGLSSIYL